MGLSYKFVILCICMVSRPKRGRKRKAISEVPADNKQYNSTDPDSGIMKTEVYNLLNALSNITQAIKFYQILLQQFVSEQWVLGC